MSSVAGFEVGKEITTVTSGASSFHAIDVNGFVNIAEPVEFRIYVYGAENVYESMGVGNYNGDDFIVEGSLLTLTDTEAPSVPQNLNASLIKDVSAYLSWDAATDNLVVRGYNVYSGSTKLNTDLILVTGYTVTGLSAGNTYTYTVRAVDMAGNESGDSSPLTLSTNRQPTAVLGATPPSGDAPLEVFFSAENSTDPDADDFILGFEWDFGDGSEINVSNQPTHIYEQPGEYTVTLRVMDNRDFYSEPVTQVINVGGLVSIAPTLTNNTLLTPYQKITRYTIDGRQIEVLNANQQGSVRAFGVTVEKRTISGKNNATRNIAIGNNR
jgi:PKD repeat protein